MRNARRTRTLLRGIAITLLFLKTDPSHGASLTITQDSSPGQAEVLYQGRPLLVYVYHSAPFKPYVKALYTLQGDNILRDAPSDHLHHHGLMYAIRINGINFWEELPDSGREIPAGALETKIEEAKDGRAQATLTQRILWVGPGSENLAPPTAQAKALFIERRQIRVSVQEANQQVAVGWHAEFEVGPAAEKVVLTGSDYNGLGLRFPESFDHQCRFGNSDGLPYPTQGVRDVLPVRWSVATGTVNEHEISVALFGQPTARAGREHFFSMIKPFAYLSVTQGLDKQPLNYARGEKFLLDYLLTVTPGSASLANLEKQYQVWQASFSEKTR